MIHIRLECPEDYPQINAIDELAFEQSGEANLVYQLREACPEALSLVAENGNALVGHILFSPVVIESGDAKIQGMGLAPMAVHPQRQREGIGSRLVREGLEILRERGYPFVVVLGHPGYYPRFGFEPASKYHLICQWDGVPNEAFMIAVFDPDALKDLRGIVRYRDEFNQVT